MKRLTLAMAIFLAGVGVYATSPIDLKAVNAVLAEITARVVAKDDFFTKVEANFNEADTDIMNDKASLTLNVGVGATRWSAEPSSLATTLKLKATKKADQEDKFAVNLDGEMGLQTDTVALVKFSSIFKDQFCEREVEDTYYDKVMLRFCKSLALLGSVEDFGTVTEVIYVAVESLREDVRTTIEHVERELQDKSGEEQAALQDDLKALRKLNAEVARIRLTQKDGELSAVLELEKSFATETLALNLKMTAAKLSGHVAAKLSVDESDYLGLKKEIARALALLAVGDDEAVQQFQGLIESYARLVKSIAKDE